MNKFRLLLFTLFLLSTQLLKAQTFVYSYTDPCTGLLKSMNVPSNGITVTYFGQIQTFNPNDFENGVFDTWAYNVYNSYGNQNPCGSVFGVSTSVDVAQGTALNFISIINNISAIADLQQSMSGPGGSLNTMSAIESAKSSSGRKDKKDKNSNSSNQSSNINSQSNSTNTEQNQSTNSQNGSSVTTSSQSNNSSQTNNTNLTGLSGNNSNNSQNNSPESSTQTNSTTQQNESSPINSTGQLNQTTTQSTSNNQNQGSESQNNSNNQSSEQNSQSSNQPQNSESNENSSSSQNSQSSSIENSQSSQSNNQNENNSGQNVNNSSETNTNNETTQNSSNQQSGTNGSQSNSETPNGSDNTTQNSEDKKTNFLGGTVKSTERSTEANKPQIVLSSDFAGFNFKSGEVEFGGKGTAGYTALSWDGRKSYGVLLDYTSIIRGPNVTGFYANIAKKRIDLISLTGTFSFYGRGSQYGSLAVGQMWNLNKSKSLKAIYMGTVSFGNVYGERFLGTAFIAGGMYDWRVHKRIDVKIMNLFIYAPYVSYYNDILLKSPYVIMPIVGTNIGITKKFKFNVNFGGAYAIKQNVMNFTLMFGTRFAL